MRLCSIQVGICNVHFLQCCRRWRADHSRNGTVMNALENCLRNLVSCRKLISNSLSHSERIISSKILLFAGEYKLCDAIKVYPFLIKSGKNCMIPQNSQAYTRLHDVVQSCGIMKNTALLEACNEGRVKKRLGDDLPR